MADPYRENNPPKFQYKVILKRISSNTEGELDKELTNLAAEGWRVDKMSYGENGNSILLLLSRQG